jgi:hypothetical protein
MWRAFFLAIGISMCIVGAECLAVDRFEFATEEEIVEDFGPEGPATLFGAPPASAMEPISQDIEPPEWAPWSLLSAGTVIILYALTINRGG